MKLQIVCRGSQRDGLGHLLRAGAFAAVACRRHEVELVAIVEPELRSLLAGVPCRVRFAQDDGDVPPLVHAFGPDVVAYDLLRLHVDVVDALRGACALSVSLSPVFDQMARVDALFTRVEPEQSLDGVRIYAGMQYAIFGDRCRPIDDARYEGAISAAEFPVAVCMGGADAPNKTLAVVRSLVQIERPLTIWVLLGEGYSHSYDALVDVVRSARHHEVILAKTSRSMWHVLSSAALAVLAGGLTTIEAVHAGLPSINLCDRPEQLHMLHELVAAGACISGGLISEATLTNVRTLVAELADDRRRLRVMRSATRGLVDGNGSHRVLAKLEQLIDEVNSSKQSRTRFPQPA